jgi:hypothetical protein
MVRAKVTCHDLTGNTLTFNPDAAPDAAIDTDVRMTRVTPSDPIALAIDNPKARAQFVVGQSYYVDIHPAHTK